MRRIVRVVVVVQVTGNASGIGASQAVVAVHVTLLALHGGVEAGEREAGRGVIEGSAAPIRRGVAVLATGRESGRHVRRIRGAVEVGLVATDAGRVGGGEVVIAVDVALRALQRGMRASQREAGRAVIEAGIAPISGAVTLLASGRQV